jgi:glucitol operon activator protein
VSGISKMLLIVFVLFILQALGGWYQIQNYRKAMRRVHQYGNVGFGQRKGRLTAGYIIMIACDHDGIITRCEIMQGLSFLAKFKPLNEFLGKDMKGRSIYEFLDDMKDFDKKQKKKYKGYINAFEALDQRLQDTKLEADQKQADQKEAVSQEAQDALA